VYGWKKASLIVVAFSGSKFSESSTSDRDNIAARRQQKLDEFILEVGAIVVAKNPSPNLTR
jgi:hypothetical protein